MPQSKPGETLRGTVVSFNDLRGYGFIRVPGMRDVFCHWKELIQDKKRKTLMEGQRVEFELGKNERGVVATNVRIIQ